MSNTRTAAVRTTLADSRTAGQDIGPDILHDRRPVQRRSRLHGHRTRDSRIGLRDRTACFPPS